MKLRNLQLTNFRCFESLTVDFHPQLTVLVADNGMGKTAVLEAIAIGLGIFLFNLPLSGVSGRNPKDTDFRIEENGKKPLYMRIRLETTEGVAWDRTERRDKAKNTLKQIPGALGYRYVSLFAEDIYFEWGKNGTPLPL
ncbi:MAG: AAA family ATPase, partial [Gammaproteobacteria bacterium]